jgi:hypothetical protein
LGIPADFTCNTSVKNKTIIAKGIAIAKNTALAAPAAGHENGTAHNPAIKITNTIHIFIMFLWSFSYPLLKQLFISSFDSVMLKFGVFNHFFSSFKNLLRSNQF